MATSGTTTFDLDIEEICEKAFELAGGELISGEDLRQARRSLNLLLIDMQNRGHPFAKLENTTFTTTSGTASYQLSAGVMDVMSMTVIRSSVATPITRVPLFEYHKIATKDDEGKPSLFTVDKDRDQPTLYLYQTPENSTDTIDYWYVKEIEDAGEYSNNLDINRVYLPAIIMGLAYYISLGRPADQINIAHRNELKQNYLNMLEMAATEDRDRASFKVRPPGYF